MVYGALDWTGPCHGECQGKLGLRGWEAGALEVAPPPPPEVPQRTLREAGEGLGPVGGILEHSSKQNLLGRGFLREWSCVINFRDSERINTFVDRGKSIEISPSL